MDRRGYPFNGGQGHDANNPLHNPQLRAALGLGNVNVDEAIYLQQRQHELQQQNLHLHQMLIHEQMGQQHPAALDSMLHQQQQQQQHMQAMHGTGEYPPDLQQHYHHIMMQDQAQRQQEELRRQQAGGGVLPHQPGANPVPSPQRQALRAAQMPGNEAEAAAAVERTAPTDAKQPPIAPEVQAAVGQDAALTIANGIAPQAPVQQAIGAPPEVLNKLAPREGQAPIPIPQSKAAAATDDVQESQLATGSNGKNEQASRAAAVATTASTAPTAATTALTDIGIKQNLDSKLSATASAQPPNGAAASMPTNSTIPNSAALPTTMSAPPNQAAAMQSAPNSGAAMVATNAPEEDAMETEAIVNGTVSESISANNHPKNSDSISATTTTTTLPPSPSRTRGRNENDAIMEDTLAMTTAPTTPTSAAKRFKTDTSAAAAKPPKQSPPLGATTPPAKTHQDAKNHESPGLLDLATVMTRADEGIASGDKEDKQEQEKEEPEGEEQKQAAVPTPDAKPETVPATTIEKAETEEAKGMGEAESIPMTPLMSDLLAATGAFKQFDDAATALVDMKVHVEWEESEKEDEEEVERKIATAKGEVIHMGSFNSILPQLPSEPEAALTEMENQRGRYILDNHKSSRRKSSSKHKGKIKHDRPAVPTVDYPYQMDTWWPSVSSIRKERKQSGVAVDEDAFTDEHTFGDSKCVFRANTRRIREKFATEAEPGVLEKIPHCKIHRLLMHSRKNPSAPEHVHCFQVTELYPNDVMVCCSQCGTWRHAACGGHYKPYSVQECINAPMTVVCDRCHEEEPILRESPSARARVDKQRMEQMRRALVTSATMRQASFSKHGGTYKWPLGSVSATHVGGHTRSVHSRHDKAERQWSEMATRLDRNFTGKGKDRTKLRTKELERLLVSVEDAEGHTDRHNMMLFLLEDTQREHPIGFESEQKNIFDPDEDEIDFSDPATTVDDAVEVVDDDSNDDNDDDDDDISSNNVINNTNSSDGVSEDMDVEDENGKSKDISTAAAAAATEGSDSDENNGDISKSVKTDDNENDNDNDNDTKDGPCARPGCMRPHRFDSAFCSDACGVSAMEMDLLTTFQYVSDMHPSMFRS